MCKERCCTSCNVQWEWVLVGNALHAFLQCGAVQEQLGERWGWRVHPEAPKAVSQLCEGNLKKAVAM